MSIVNFNTDEDFKDTRFGGYLLEIVELLALPIPSIKAVQLKRFHKEGVWCVKLHHPGRETAEDIQFKTLSDSMEKGVNVAMQELIGRLCGKYHQELKDHFLHELGRRDENGHPLLTDEETKRGPLV